MILIQNYITQNTFYITSISDSTVSQLKRIDDLPISLSDSGHWIAEPSAIKALEQYCEKHGHTFTEMVAK